MAGIPGIDHFYMLQESALSSYFTDENVKSSSQVLTLCHLLIWRGRPALPDSISTFNIYFIANVS